MMSSACSQAGQAGFSRVKRQSPRHQLACKVPHGAVAAGSVSGSLAWTAVIIDGPILEKGELDSCTLHSMSPPFLRGGGRASARCSSHACTRHALITPRHVPRSLPDCFSFVLVLVREGLLPLRRLHHLASSRYPPRPPAWTAWPAR